MNVQLSSAFATGGVFIGNHWKAAQSGRTLDVVSPADGAPFAKIAAGGKADIDEAVATARRASEEGPWPRMTATERGRLLSKLAVAIELRTDELTALEARDTGKPLKQARADIVAAARYFEFYGGAADKLHGETIPFLNGYFVPTERVPFGVTAHIIPWNYPAQMFGRTIAPALAVGNTTVIKPAEEACLTPLRFAELAASVGFPDGVINIVPGLGEEAGAALANHPGIDFISFTGSPEVGTLIQTAAAKNHIGCTLELGGKSPHVLFSDADLEVAIPVIVNTVVQNAGQTCSAGSRLLIEKSAYDKVVAGIQEKFKTLRAGTPEMDLDLGPVISANQKKRVEGFFERATGNGVPILAEGAIADNVPAGGYFVAPRIYGPVPRTNELATQEVFGPVLSILPFEDEADAVRLANGTDFGLMAGVWSRNGSRALRVARQVKAGQVYINAYGAGGGIELPFGGMKKSGHGREKGFEALYEFSTLKTMIIKHG
ncbi:aldehyde dehydrogenase family protein [Bradyrhizobium sp. PRIMUS42]|uniref:aldehyde dehydrogenase family protein n=1 Tax=Bradyrhizobium sp. PRIMUS42 TaxID=2908926 RepID=UPI001FF2FA46|nr:aldehyde dehydrogenase family protein [Bradyrhizobium sp. PRIMUS42]MCJ9728693.1 aldehyde dehydrogenase family protein [Bradyrhizobium sp. PRIMUS42]